MNLPAEAPAYCRNCSFFLGATPGKYCPHCGQDTATHPPSAWEFLHEFVTHYIALEGKLANTLGLLVFRPGELTKRYLAGRKARYVLPLRLYLTASIVFFLVVKIFGAGNLVKNEVGQDSTKNVVVFDKATALKKEVSVGKPGATVGATVSDENMLRKPFLEAINCESAEFAGVQCAKFKNYLKDRYQDLTLLQVGRQVKDRTMSLAPYAMFFCLPVFALSTRVLYANRKMYYGEHLVYALHVHAFAFLLLLVVATAPDGFGEWLYFAGAVYFWLAMKRVFGGRWLPTFLRYVLIAILYPMLLMLVTGATMIAAVFV